MTTPLGQNLSATTFPAANAVLGTTYGNPGNFAAPHGCQCDDADSLAAHQSASSQFD
jgi:hypothetical protein